MIELTGDGAARATAVMTILLLIFGEILPKTLAPFHTTATALRSPVYGSRAITPCGALLQSFVMFLRFPKAEERHGRNRLICSWPAQES